MDIIREFILKQEKEKIEHPEYYNKPVVLVRSYGSSIPFESIYEAYLCTNVSKENILRCCLDKNGFVFIDKIKCTFKFQT